MSEYTSNRQRQLKIGISSYTENQLVLDVIGNTNILGIANLGNVQVSSGVITATSGIITYYGDGSKLLNIVSATANYANLAGVATYANNAGVATYSDFSGIANYANSSGVATYADNAGIANYANSSGISTLADIATYALSAGIATYAISAGIATYAGIAGIATYAPNAGVSTALQYSRTFQITGDVVSSIVSFDGTQNVSLASTIQPNSVELGTDTYGDYVQSISGTANQIDVIGGTGESSTPTVSIALNPLLPGNVTIQNDLQVNNNLNVTGNITIGGTSAYIIVNDFRVKDKDIVLGFTTDSYGNDVSNDSTANHGGISVASTEGNPLVELYNVGAGETSPATYKKIMWFKAGSFAGQNEDAWLVNYAVGIGSTQFPAGTILAAGAVQFTENDLKVIRNINASGIITASNFVGKLTGVASVTSLSVSGVSTLGSVRISSGIITAASGIVSYYGDGGGLINIQAQSIVGIVTYAANAGLATLSQGLTGVPNLVVGIVTASEYYGNFRGTLNSDVVANYSTNAGVATYAVSSGIATYAVNAGVATYADNAGIATNVIGGIGSITNLTVSGVSTLGNVQVSSGIVTASTGIVTYYGDGQYLQNIISGIQVQSNTQNTNQFLTYSVSIGTTTLLGITTSGLTFNPSTSSLGIGTTNPTANLYVVGNSIITGIVTFLNTTENTLGNADTGSVQFDGGVGINGNITVGSGLSVTGNSTLVGNLSVNGNTTLGDTAGDTITINGTATFGQIITGTISTATRALNVDTTTASATTYYPALLGSSTGTSSTSIYVDGGIAYNAGTDTLTLTGDLAVNGADVTTSGGTATLFNANASSVNAFGAATALIVGATTGIATINNPTLVGTQATQNLYNTVATSVNAFGAATSLTMGAASGTATLNNATVTLANATTLNVNGASPTISGTSTGTLTFFNSNLTAVNAFGAANTIFIGKDSTGITTVRTKLTVGGNLEVDGNQIQSSTGATVLTLSSQDATFANNVTVSGDLVVNGTTTQVNTQELQVYDRTITLGIQSGTTPTTTTWDLGVMMNYGVAGVGSTAGMIWESSNRRFQFASMADNPTAGVSTSLPQITVSSFAPIEVSELWVNNSCTGGSSRIVGCTAGTLILENITVDCGTF